jgi:prolycopene isomerase
MPIQILCLNAAALLLLQGLYCVGDSTFPGQGVNAVVFSGFGCAHRVAVDIGLEPGWPAVDKAYASLLNYVRDRS